MPRTSVISGSFSQNDQPARGWVRFTPSRLWVVQEGVAWASLAPETPLDYDGSFTVQVTSTDSDPINWFYYICTPAGCYQCHVPYNVAGWSLRELISEHRSRARAPH